jgi:hypothetical protein
MVLQVRVSFRWKHVFKPSQMAFLATALGVKLERQTECVQNMPQDSVLLASKVEPGMFSPPRLLQTAVDLRPLPQDIHRLCGQTSECLSLCVMSLMGETI